MTGDELDRNLRRHAKILGIDIPEQLKLKGKTKVTKTTVYTRLDLAELLGVNPNAITIHVVKVNNAFGHECSDVIIDFEVIITEDITTFDGDDGAKT
jgi:hypothetical protein